MEKCCDKCYEWFEEGEIHKFDKESEKLLCIACKYEFDWRLKNFLIEFFNQPERLNETDHDGETTEMICDSLNTANK